MVRLLEGQASRYFEFEQAFLPPLARVPLALIVALNPLLPSGFSRGPPLCFETPFVNWPRSISQIPRLRRVVASDLLPPFPPFPWLNVLPVVLCAGFHWSLQVRPFFCRRPTYLPSSGHHWRPSDPPGQVAG